MTDRVPTADIERVVGVPRHAALHYGRKVVDEQRLYILHSQQCLRAHDDLRDCPYSLALDHGIRPRDWPAAAVVLGLEHGRLTPIGVVPDA